MSKLPSYVTQYNFNQERLDEFLKSGDLGNEYDSFGNLLLTSANEVVSTNSTAIEKHLIAIGTSKRKYSRNKLDEFMDTEFTEFLDGSSPGDTLDQTSDMQNIETNIAKQLSQENILQTQIDELSDILEQETDKNIKGQEDSEANYRAAKALIIQQRIAAGEGSSEADFSDAFPFLSLTDAQLAAGETGVENSPFMRSPGGYT